MTQHQREELVERYLTGSMTQQQESDFFLNVAVDDQLQRTLKAYQIVDNAIKGDGAEAVSERSPYRSQVMTLLAATPAVIGTGAAVAAGTASAAASGSATSAATGAAIGWKTVLLSLLGASAITATAVTLGPALLNDSSEGQTPSEQTSPAIEGRYQQPTLEQAPTAVDTLDAVSAEQPSAAPATVERPEPASASPTTSTPRRTSTPSRSDASSTSATSSTPAASGTDADASSRRPDRTMITLDDDDEKEVRVKTTVEDEKK